MTEATAPTGARGAALAGYLALAMGIGPLAHYALSALGPLVVDDLDLSATRFGSLWLVAFGAAALATPLAGRLTDQLGAQRMLRWTFLCAGAAIVTVSLAGSIAVLMVGVALAGLAVAISNPATNLAVAGAVERGRQGVIVGAKQSGVQGSQLFVGLALPGLAVLFGWRPALLACLILAVVGLVWGRSVSGLGGPHATRRGRGEAHIHPDVWWLTSYALVAGVLIQATNVYLPLYAHVELGLSVGEAGLVSAVLGGTGVVARLGWGRAMDKVENVPVLLMGLALLAALGLVLCSLASAGPDVLVWLGAGVFGFSALAANAVIMSSVVRSAAPGSVGRSTGWAALGLYVGFMIGPVTFGVVVDSVGGYTYAWLYLVALTAVLVALMSSWSWMNRRSRSAVSSDTVRTMKETH